MATCIAAKYNNCFGGELYRDDKGESYCIVHAPIVVREKLGLTSRFLEILKEKKRVRSNDFSGCQFDDNAKFSYLGGKDEKLILKDCLFNHIVDLTRRNLGFLVFSGSIFNKGVKCEDAIFYEKVFFVQ
jgi:hypothetical protein